MTNNKNAIDMKTISFSKNINFRWLFVVTMGIMASSCGSYQNSSYYDNDGIYGESSNSQQRVASNENANSNYYQNYFSSINQESQELFTNVDNYSTPVDTTATVEQTQQRTANGYNGWGNNNSSDVTVNYYGGGWYGAGWGWNNWGYNGWYGNGWYGAGWGWNNWYGPGWGWNNWGYGGWYSPYWGYGYYGNPYYYGYGYGNPYYYGYNNGWSNNYAYNRGRRNTIYTNSITPNSGRNFVASTRNGSRANSEVRPTNLNVRPTSSVRSNTVTTSGTRPNYNPNSTSVNTVRNNSIQTTPTRTDSPTRSYTPAPSRSYSPSGGGGSYGGGGFGGGGGRSGGGGGRR